jgi:hypothetical protein
LCRGQSGRRIWCEDPAKLRADLLQQSVDAPDPEAAEPLCAAFCLRSTLARAGPRRRQSSHGDSAISRKQEASLVDPSRAESAPPDALDALRIELSRMSPKPPPAIYRASLRVARRVSASASAGNGDRPCEGTRPRSDAIAASRMCPRRVRRTCPAHRRNEPRGSAPDVSGSPEGLPLGRGHVHGAPRRTRRGCVPSLV